MRPQAMLEEMCTARKRGSWRAILGLGALLALAPLTAVLRWWSRWRRGSEVKVTVAAAEPHSGAQRTYSLVQVDVDCPTAGFGAVSREMTRVVVRVAELLRQPDDVFHHVRSELRPGPGDEALRLSAIGPKLNLLGDRFLQALTSRANDGWCQIWLALPRNLPLGQVLQGYDLDPEAEGEPGGLLSSIDARWAVASEVVYSECSVLARLLLFVPEGAEPRAVAVVAALEQLELRTDQDPGDSTPG